MVSSALLVFAVALADATNSIKAVSNKLGHAIEVKQGAFIDQARGYKIEGNVVSVPALEKYAPLWIEEWSRYSKDLIVKSKVQKVVFAEKLSMNGQPRAAVPAFDLNTMYFDPALGAHSDSYQRSVIHHELFHMLDYRMGKLRKDTEWMALNPKDFKYGSGGHNMRTAGVGTLTDQIPGFLTIYGTSALEEDKAELFAHLIVNTKFVSDLAPKDKVLQSKIDLLKKRMNEFDSGFDSKFWPKP